jgi:hypothetical protein
VLCVVAMSPPGGSFCGNVTLCDGVATKVQVTVPPAVILTQDGEKIFDPVAVTSALADAPPAVTFTVTPGFDVTVPELAVIVDDPTPTPVAVVEVPDVLESETAWPLAAQVIGAPETAPP